MQRLITLIDEVLGNSGKVEDASVLCVDSRAVIKGGEHFLKRDGPQLRRLAVSIGRSDDLSGTHTTTKHDRGIGLRPVIATVVAVDFGSSPEFTPDDN